MTSIFRNRDIRDTLFRVIKAFKGARDEIYGSCLMNSFRSSFRSGGVLLTEFRHVTLLNTEPFLLSDAMPMNQDKGGFEPLS